MSEPGNGAPRRPGQEALRPLPKRFYKDVAVAEVFSPPPGGESPPVDVLQSPPPYPTRGEGSASPRRAGGAPSARRGGERAAFRLLLDGKPVRTPAKNHLLLPTRALADAVAAEWHAQGERIDPATMPLTRFANSAIDGVLGREAEVRADIVKYAGSDLVCYRAEGPRALAERQASVWDPVLDWAAADLSARFVLAQGLMPVEQPREAVAGVAEAVRSLNEFQLTGLHVATTLTGSAVLALAVFKGYLSPQQAWTAAHVDEDYQIEQWGADAEAEARRASRWREMQAACLMMRAG